MSQTVAVYFNQPGTFDYPFHTDHYLHSYANLTDFFQKQGLDLVVVRGDSYQGNMTFSHGWRFDGQELVDIDEPLTVDLIWNKELAHDLNTNPGDLVINEPEFDYIGRHKWLTYEAFADIMPKTAKITTDNWQTILKETPSNKVVLKPIDGTEGRGIIIEEKSQINFPALQTDGAYLAQEFIDSSGGIPGICDGPHDLRVVVFAGVPAVSHVRTPKAGELLSNVAQGGTLHPVDITDVPKPMMDNVKIIDSYYERFPYRNYTVDMFLGDDGKAYLIETNTRPGLPNDTIHGKAYSQKFYQALTDLFVKALADRQQSP